MQLVAYGAQDVYLTANPQVTFFKQLYRRHSNFAMESIEQTFNGVGNFGKRVQCTISRNGDLITRVYVQVTLPAIDQPTIGAGNKFSWVPFLGQYMINNVYVEIGGQQIDKHYGEWLHVWNELTLPTGKREAYANMVNGFGGAVLAPDASCNVCQTELSAEDATKLTCLNAQYSFGLACVLNKNVASDITSVNGCIPEQTLYIPLEFWFNRHTGLALPLIALQYHEVKINVEFENLQYLCNIDTTGSNDTPQKVLNAVANQGLVACSLYVDYIYLDTEERRRFAQVAHEYLIEQLQFTGGESVSAAQNNIKMSFNHPVKELVWVTQLDQNVDCDYAANEPFNYTDDAMNNPTAVAKIQLNGHDRFDARFGTYFNFVQPYQHHTRSPALGINVYSFALKPEEHQPSGTCNFSRIDNAVLNLTLSPYTLKSTAVSPVALTAQVRIYAVNYNVLRVMSGMGGLAYSN